MIPSRPTAAIIRKPRRSAADPRTEDLFEVDETIDASLYAIYKFHMFEADDPRVVSTMRAVEQKLWVKTRVGGVARYENDYYHRVSNDIASVPGNPWFICTLWLADYYITRAKTTAELKTAMPIFEWTAVARAGERRAGRAGESLHQRADQRQPADLVPCDGGEHCHQISGEARSTCSFATSASSRFTACAGAAPVEVQAQAHFDRLDAEFDVDDGRETASPDRANSSRDPTPQGVPGRAPRCRSTRATASAAKSASPTAQGVLRMIDGKALVDLRQLNQCDLDGECVDVCPTKVVTLKIFPFQVAAELPRPDAA